MIRFFKKLFKRGDFMTRADKAYYKYRAKTIFWSAFCMIIIAWVGTNLVLCALTTNVESNSDIIYEAPRRDVILPRNFSQKIKKSTSDTVEDKTVKTITFDYYTPQILNLIVGKTPEVLNEDDDIKLYRLNSGADVYILSHNNICADYLYQKFEQYKKLTTITFNNFDTSRVSNMEDCFYRDEALQNLDLSGWDTSNVTTMEDMFLWCSKLKTIKGIEDWDVRNVNNFMDMFCHVESFVGTLDLSKWQTTSMTNIEGIFSTCGAEEIIVSGWDTSQVTNMEDAFSFCYYLKSLDLSEWDTSNVENMRRVFSTSDVMVTLDLTGWDTSQVTDMTVMFHSCYALQTIYASESFVTTNVDVDSADTMFYDCRALVGGNGTTYDESRIDSSFARIDGGPSSSTPGYFTAK